MLDYLNLPTAAPSLSARPDQPGGLAAAQPRDWFHDLLLDDPPVPDPVPA